jgi:hypothetical protein
LSTLFRDFVIVTEAPQNSDLNRDGTVHNNLSRRGSPFSS